MLILQLAAILLASKLAGDISVKLGQPSVLGKLLVGILLGPAVLGIVTDTDILSEISNIGVILLMFIAGLETDIDEFKRTGKASASVGVFGIVLPFTGGYLAGLMMNLTGIEAAFLGLLLSATSVSISVQSLKEMNQLKSREGTTILGAAVIDDVLVMIFLAFLLSMAGGDVSLAEVALKKVIFFVVAILVAWKVVPLALKFLAPTKSTEAVVSTALVICFLYAYFAEMTGVAGIIGAYVAGLAISVTDYKHKVFEKIDTIAYSIFVPVFFTSIGVAVTFTGIGDDIDLIIYLSILAVLTKLIGSAIGAKLSGFGWNGSFGIGSGMVSRGEVALIIAAIGLDEMLITDDLFTTVVVVVLVTTIMTPPLMKFFFNRKEKEEMDGQNKAKLKG
ncbi:cation:proton antiporter [Longirhabdus pacifica]|uniref:cation:proton antiporter n=1 Tax=Longirhabdus pacifica TaxID=2305227 RepID=UPI0010086B45|nr:cation:proton antiporter [Longirhabdus pacifica]